MQKQNTKNTVDEKAILESKIQELITTIDRIEDEKLNITNQFKRALADYQNLEKNTSKLIQLRYLQTKRNLAENIIPVVDSLTIAMKSKLELSLDEHTKSWIDGVSASVDNLEKVFVDIGLEKFVPQKGEMFDPQKHEALTTVTDGIKNTIFETIQPGYTLDGILIRPARVVVTK